jgi:hypothetical protein
VSLIVNRLHPDPAEGRRPTRSPVPALSPGFAAKLVAVHRDQALLARVERRGLTRLEVDTGAPPILVPEFDADVHDLRGLADIAAAIFGAAAAGARGRRRATAS